MRKSIYTVSLEGYYQIVNYNKGRRMVSKNKNKLFINDVFTENTIESIKKDERCMKRIRRMIKVNKEIEITINKINEFKFISMSNDIY